MDTETHNTDPKLITYPKEGCNTCKHYKTEANWLPTGKYMPAQSCLIGNQDDMEAWWNENGHKTEIKSLTPMPCHEFSDAQKALINMNRSLQEMNDLLAEKRIDEAKAAKITNPLYIAFLVANHNEPLPGTSEWKGNHVYMNWVTSQQRVFNKENSNSPTLYTSQEFMNWIHKKYLSYENRK